MKDHPRAQSLLQRFSNLEIVEIDKIEDVFGRVKKPYLQKRESLNLFIGEKKGQLVKEAPEAYGTKGDPHYYFIHAYNCIYECEYCYLQGYFHSPDLVFFLNYEDIGEEIRRVANNAQKGQTIWFHAGEFSDSLALTHLTGEIPYYFELFKDLPNAKLELRTKSANTRELLKQSPLENIVTTFSLAPEEQVKSLDHKTPGLKTRLKAMKELYAHGHPLALHLDPVVYNENFKTQYQSLLEIIDKEIPLDYFQYISTGVVRFTKDVYRQLQMNYPNSAILSQELVKGEDNKVRYTRPMRMHILQTLKELCCEYTEADKVYLCME